MALVDARGMRCPWPAIRAARAARTREGDDVTILADDPAAAVELTKLADSLGAELAIEAGAESARYRMIFGN